MNAILMKRSLPASCFPSAVLPSVLNTHLLDHWAVSARIRSSARGYGSWISKGARSCSLEASSGRSQSSLESSGAGLGAGWVALGLASVLSTSPPGLCEELQSSSGESRCELTRVQTQRYQYAYPGSWFLEHVRGIEVLAHDPEVGELNMTVTSGPATSGALPKSAEEVGKAIMNRYEKAPSVDKAQLLDVDLREAGSNSRDYIVELIVDARGKQRHLLSKLILTDRKVYAVTVQVPQELWEGNGDCMRTVLQAFQPRGLVTE
ncbi:hypothetical protein CY35_04G026800 [Sphagnum magellanicum]|nr:hypothetical protein CY35_04G026800 [Sphagnum magellanicum]